MIVGTRREMALLVIIGFGIGMALGLYLAWMVWPHEYYDSDPSKVRREFIEEYILIIAAQHALDGDIERARERLNQLGLADPVEAVAQVTNRSIAQGGDPITLRTLAGLSYSLGIGTSGMAVYLQTATPTSTPPATSTDTPTRTPTATQTSRPTLTATPQPEPSTPTPQPTSTPSPTSLPYFLLTEKRRICGEEEDRRLIQVQVTDLNGKGLPNIELVVSWSSEGGESVFTGLKPEHGLGYADFEMRNPRRSYQVMLPTSGDVVRDLEADPAAAGCPAGNTTVSWQLTFVGKQQP